VSTEASYFDLDVYKMLDDEIYAPICTIKGPVD